MEGADTLLPAVTSLVVFVHMCINLILPFVHGTTIG